ncbi:S16 family serine protease [Glaciihabitans sp. dw_435]|uniref:YlbL family protein n=1 Tax=Glaciihabitans sp. dw_435 TaxID=2720081 RepID=UPI001BD64BCF|nr:S16 family serine protease [Glaciihabitans sp. dw_435]
MSLFTDTERDLPPRSPRRTRVGWILLLVAIIGVGVVAFVPAPYVIEQPGPVFNTLSKVTVDNKEVQMIDIPVEKTYPTDGSLDMLTVSVNGNRAQRPSWLEIATAWLDPSKAVVPLENIYPAGVTDADSKAQSAADMVDSQKEAVAAALHELGIKFTTTLTVAAIAQGSPAESQLKAGDVIESINGTTFTFLGDVSAAVIANGADKPATVVVLRDGVKKTLSITPKLNTTVDPAVPQLGIGVAADYTFPFDVKIQLQDVGGPSAGMMFALGIIDKLTPGELNGGEQVAGTGTIDASGTVGAIGGIRQKLYGAKQAGAKWFLAPASNCNEVVDHVPSGLTVYAVKTLQDSLTALKAIDSGTGLDALATCNGS